MWHFLPYLKPMAKELLNNHNVFSFGEVPQDTWIITPRERVETLMKRVKFWREELRASEEDCRGWLVKIGYPDYLINSNLANAYRAD